MPNVAATAAPVADADKPDGPAFVPFSKGRGQMRGRGRGSKLGGGRGRGGKKKNDPLKKFR